MWQGGSLPLALRTSVHQHRAVGIGQAQGCCQESWLLVAQQAWTQALAPLVKSRRRALLLVAGIGGGEPRAELLAGGHGSHKTGRGLGQHWVLGVIWLAPQASMGRAADQRRVILITGLRLDGRDCGREKHRAAAIMAACERVLRKQRPEAWLWEAEWAGTWLVCHS